MTSISELFKKVFALYTNNLRILSTLIIFSLVWNIVFNLIPESSIYSETSSALLKIIFSAIVLIISAFTEIALIYGFSDMLHGKTPQVGEIFKKTVEKIPWFIVLVILWGVTIFFGALLLIIPAIIFATWFMFIAPVFVLENAKGFDAFRKSKQLVDGNFFPLLIRAVITLISIIFLTTMATAGFSFAMNLLSYALPANIISSIVNVFGAALSSFATPILSATIIILYFEMKKTRKI